MNKFIKISISFIIFGLVLIGLATYLNNGHIPRFSSNFEKKNYTISINDVKNLDLDIIDSDVTIEENTASKNMEIEYYTALERKVNIEHIGNKLSIKENKNIVGINFNFLVNVNIKLDRKFFSKNLRGTTKNFPSHFFETNQLNRHVEKTDILVKGLNKVSLD